jgi:hypothetical protein
MNAATSSITLGSSLRAAPAFDNGVLSMMR